ncbi:MAG TPA: nucleoside 2-deoxyribosyltransferase [Actinophytocola sp.]|uniref:nucleoside 2-deoxyribosyltransferase n=1 Tax=Actinophytocola sp. TaxID=1872138 RepID=UPI002DDD3D8C|nr:nucleoside 2-deoxyribosyltransferase [Actinophytocola sp.]HEV2778236.1 nucleoside 2-deoxyribosyltransferase [Actinophytocola sp.]
MFTNLNSVFVGGPMYQLLDPSTGLMSDRDKARFTTLIEYFERHGATVYNAHRREAWGARLLTPPEATRLDFTEIRQADLFVALPGVPPSPGTHVEIGWASALGKPMVLLLEHDASHAFLVTGLETVANVELVWFTDPMDIVGQLEVAVPRVLARRGGAVSPASAHRVAAAEP